jgi:DNA-directed RNA polymerase subunit RPC12/RpoP
MSQGMAQGALAGKTIELSAHKERVHCNACGSDKVVRVFREGFMQEKILPLLGYYPWRCMRCGVRVTLRKRNRRKKKEYAE